MRLAPIAPLRDRDIGGWFSSLTLASACVGVWRFSLLPIDATPDITNVQVQINTEAPAIHRSSRSNASRSSSSLRSPGLPRLDYTRSLSRYGLSQVTVVFEDSTDIYFARQQIAERIAQVSRSCPPALALSSARSRPDSARSSCTRSRRSGRHATDGKPWTAMDLRSIHDWVVRPQLRTTPGVTEVSAIGGYVRQIHVTPDPARLLAHGFTLDDVIKALSENNQMSAPAISSEAAKQLLVRIPNQAADLGALEAIGARFGVTAYRSGFATSNGGRRQ